MTNLVQWHLVHLQSSSRTFLFPPNGSAMAIPCSILHMAARVILPKCKSDLTTPYSDLHQPAVLLRLKPRLLPLAFSPGGLSHFHSCSLASHSSEKQLFYFIASLLAVPARDIHLQPGFLPHFPQVFLHEPFLAMSLSGCEPFWPC